MFKLNMLCMQVPTVIENLEILGHFIGIISRPVKTWKLMTSCSEYDFFILVLLSKNLTAVLLEIIVYKIHIKNNWRSHGYSLIWYLGVNWSHKNLQNIQTKCFIVLTFNNYILFSGNIRLVGMFKLCMKIWKYQGNFIIAISRFEEDMEMNTNL